MDELVARTVDEFGGLDVLVNNAAAVDEGHSYDAEELDPDSWDRQLRVNLRSVYYLSRLAIPHLRARGGGSIVNVSSVGSLVVWEKAAAYLTSKGAINQLTRSMAIDFQPDEIRVNAVLPGWIRTEIEEKRLAENPNAIEEALAVRSIRRLGKPSEIASAALFLASDDASYVTGTCLVVDGGWTLS
jgi:3-oxoacyl-[acyl-carrier protein] reductase